MATIADVAALARVSKATASRAFTRPGMVSPATAQRVREAADKLGYVANSAARQLAGGRTGIVALVVPTLVNTFFAPIIGGAQARIAAEGQQLTVVVHPLERPEELLALSRLSRQVDGYLVVAPRGSDDLVSAAFQGVPAVLVDREIDGFSSVVADTATAFGALAEGLAAQGHERLVYIGGPAGSWQDRQRLAAVRAAAERAGARLTALGPFPSTFSAGVAAAEQVREAAPDAVIPYATAIGLGVQHAFLAAGRTPPLVSSEREVVAALGLAGVPAIDVDGEQLGRVAADMLVAQLAEPAAGSTRTRLPVPVEWRR